MKTFEGEFRTKLQELMPRIEEELVADQPDDDAVKAALVGFTETRSRLAARQAPRLRGETDGFLRTSPTSAPDPSA